MLTRNGITFWRVPDFAKRRDETGGLGELAKLPRRRLATRPRVDTSRARRYASRCRRWTSRFRFAFAPEWAWARGQSPRYRAPRREVLRIPRRNTCRHQRLSHFSVNAGQPKRGPRGVPWLRLVRTCCVWHRATSPPISRLQRQAKRVRYFRSWNEVVELRMALWLM